MAKGIPVHVGGDFNAHQILWGGRRHTAGGKVVQELMIPHNLVPLNEGDVPTFVNANGSSVIDLTLTNPECVEYITSWGVIAKDRKANGKTYNGSDHRTIETRYSSRPPDKVFRPRTGSAFTRLGESTPTTSEKRPALVSSGSPLILRMRRQWPASVGWCTSSPDMTWVSWFGRMGEFTTSTAEALGIVMDAAFSDSEEVLPHHSHTVRLSNSLVAPFTYPEYDWMSTGLIMGLL